MARLEDSPRVAWLVKVASVAIVIAALYLAKGLLVPFTLAVLLSFLLAPVCELLEHWRFGRVPAVLGTTLLAFLLMGMLAWGAMLQMADLAKQLPHYQENIETKLRSANGFISGTFSSLSKTTEHLHKDLANSNSTSAEIVHGERSYAVRIIPAAPNPLAIASGMFGTLIEVLGMAGIVIIFVIFFLVRREDLRDRFIRLVGYDQLTMTTQALEDAAARVSRYLLSQLFVNVVFGVAGAIGLYFIGVPNAMLWGLLGIALRFVPYIGPSIAAALPILLAFAVSPRWMEPMLTLGWFVILELILANAVEPWLYGKNTGVSPVAVLLAAVFWTWLWGAIGLLLAMPLAVCLVVIGKYVPQLSFLDTILGDEPVFDMTTRVYQRLLAGDQEEATELVEEQLRDKSLAEVYDSLLIPVLALAEKDSHRGELVEARREFVIQGVKDMVDVFGERDSDTESSPSKEDLEKNGDTERFRIPTSAKIRVLCLPARDEADEIAATMLAQLLNQNGYLAEVVSSTTLAGEMLDHLAERQADLVCISAIPPAATAHSRYFCKRLRARFPDLNLVVGLWTVPADLTKAKQRIGSDEHIHVVKTLTDAQDHIRLAIQPLLLRSDRLEPDLSHPSEQIKEASAALRV
ncbi:MAG: AI-2E family transporter [Planctomycetaceae bacterium]|nr:AI-2E family transporter [Planctomycetaceae bacterium]